MEKSIYIIQSSISGDLKGYYVKDQCDINFIMRFPEIVVLEVY
jgi:hypothetical protein